MGYSAFCGLFTYAEWEGYEYSIDLAFAGNNMFQSPTGRAVGIGYVVEILSRLQGHVITQPTAQINVTLDNNTSTFPLGQTLNFGKFFFFFSFIFIFIFLFSIVFLKREHHTHHHNPRFSIRGLLTKPPTPDFSHDTNIASILTAFGLTQFAPVLPADHLERNRSLIVSHMEPFGARLDMEIIETPKPLSGNRKNSGGGYATTYEDDGGVTRYIHFILNQRTIPLGKSFAECGNRDDGWCELTTFMEVQSKMLETAEYEFSCFGEYPVVPYGGITNGVPVTKPS